MRECITPTTNIVFAGLGGQGIILASEIFCIALFESGFDVKKSEIHGMSQRGGSVKSDIRFGKKVYSPLIPDGETDILVAFHPSELERNKIFLKSAGKSICVKNADKLSIPSSKVTNLFLLGKLSLYIPVEQKKWEEVIMTMVPSHFVDQNLEAFFNGVNQERTN